MTSNQGESGRHVLVPGQQEPIAGAALAPDQPVEVTVVLRRRGDGVPGTDPDDLAVVRDVLTAGGLSILSVHEPSRRMRVAGSVATICAAFGTTLAAATTPRPDGTSETYRIRTGGISVPAEIGERVLAVLGLDERPQARTQFRIAAAGTPAASYPPPQLGTLYRFPANTDGTGQTVAIIELGGGFGTADLDAYFGGLGLPTPSVTAVGVDGAQNRPGQDPQGADGEVLLDVEVVGALAPGAAIVVYFAPNTDAGFLDAVSEAAHASPTPCAISISWGGNEDTWTAQGRSAMDAAFADAVSLGTVVTAAAGDRGSSDGATDGSNHVDFPASSPHVLGCGGTSLLASDGAISSETVWNRGTNGATGGGVSAVFDRPSWQTDAGVPGTGRGVPDVAGNADPQTGYQVLVDGTSTVIGGTSAVAPLWAALVARLAQATGARLTGFVEALYAGVGAGAAAAGFRDITAGNNGSYSAGPGWDACTGLGSPDGTALLGRLAPPVA